MAKTFCLSIIYAPLQSAQEPTYTIDENITEEVSD